MSRKERPPPSGDRRGPEVSQRLGGSTIAMLPREADHGNAERQRQARARLAAQEYHHRLSGELERRAPLSRFYGARPLLDVTIGQLYVRGRWAM
jgi:hypothetical protein